MMGTFTARERALLGLFGATVAIALASRFMLPIATLTRHICYNNNEGWGAYWSARALSGQPLYTDAASPLTDNYVPLSFYITGLLGRAIGDTIVAGRILCLGGLLACAGLIGAIVRRFGGAWGWGIATALAFLTIGSTVAWRYIAQNDPQWLAAAVELVGLLLLVQARPVVPGAARIVAACAVLLLAGLIKHNQVALPIAITVALAVHDRRGLGVWLASGALLLAATLAGLQYFYGHAFFDQVLHHERTIAWHHFSAALGTMAFCLPAMVVIALRWRAMKQLAPVDFRRTLLLAFAVLGTVLGIPERMGAGVSQNAHFDAIIAILALAGVAISVPGGRYGTLTARLTMMIAVIMPVATKAVLSLPRHVREVAAVGDTEAAWARAIGFVAAQPGPVLCESPALCYWAGKPYDLDFFNYGQKLRLIGDPAHILAQIEARKFGAIAVFHDDKYWHHDARLTWPYYQAIDARYHVVQQLPDDYVVMAPNR